MALDWTEIERMPDCFFDAATGFSHESLLRSWHIVEKVRLMIERGDSKETILEAIARARAGTGRVLGVEHEQENRGQEVAPR